jgi:hypothetical protein
MWEKHKQRALVVVAILLSAAVASAARNERRLFLLPEELRALSAVPAPEPTSLRSAILGYLNDGCEPVLDAATGNFVHALDRADCGPARRRAVAPAPAEPIVPAAYFAAPDAPIPLDGSPLLVVSGLSPEPVALPVIGGNPFGAPPAFGTYGQPVALLSGVPEPASWALMIAGFALAGAALRSRPRTRAAFA